jgi:hypothetical protein
MIIGSQAIQHHLGNKFWREPKDLDIIGTTTLQQEKKVEILPNPVLERYYNYSMPEYIGLDELYTLKCSHSFWELKNKSWAKHLYDIQMLQEGTDCKLIPDLFWDLYKYWLSLHGPHKKSNLDMSAEEFFDNALNTGFDHDTAHTWLIEHEHFKGQQKPTYTQVLKDGAEVDVCMDKFNALSDQQKFNVVFEEVALMAFERWPKAYYKASYETMLRKFICEHCYPEEGLWIIQNHKNLLCNIPFDFNKFLTKKLQSAI